MIRIVFREGVNVVCCYGIWWPRIWWCMFNLSHDGVNVVFCNNPQASRRHTMTMPVAASMQLHQLTTRFACSFSVILANCLFSLVLHNMFSCHFQAQGEKTMIKSKKGTLWDDLCACQGDMGIEESSGEEVGCCRNVDVETEMWSRIDGQNKERKN